MSKKINERGERTKCISTWLPMTVWCTRPAASLALARAPDCVYSLPAMLPKKVVCTEAVIEILSFGVGGMIAIMASVKETEIWSSTCTPRLPPDETCPIEATCPVEGASCPSNDPPSWDEGRLEMVWESIRCAPLKHACRSQAWSAFAREREVSTVRSPYVHYNTCSIHLICRTFTCAA